MVDMTADVTVPTAVGNDALPELKNPAALEWVKTIPGLGKNSPEYAILHDGPRTRLRPMEGALQGQHVRPHAARYLRSDTGSSGECVFSPLKAALQQPCASNRSCASAAELVTGSCSKGNGSMMLCSAPPERRTRLQHQGWLLQPVAAFWGGCCNRESRPFATAFCNSSIPGAWPRSSSRRMVQDGLPTRSCVPPSRSSARG